MDARHYSRGDEDNYGRRKLRIVDYTLDDAELDARCPLDNGRHVILAKQPVGQLNLLPAELMDQILRMLRHTNINRLSTRQPAGHAPRRLSATISTAVDTLS